MSFDLLKRLAEHADRKPEAVAYRFVSSEVSGKRELTWKQLERAVTKCAARFASILPAGQTLLISSPNRIEWPVAALAGWAAGLRVFAVSPELSGIEVKRLVKQTHVAGAVVGGDTRAADVLAGELEHIWPIEELLVDDSEPVTFASRDGAILLLQSSGTTGFPRVVCRRAAPLDAVADGIVNSIGFTPQDRVLAMLPLSHSYGIEHGLLAPVWAGATVLLGQGLDVHVLTRELAGGATILPTVPSVIEALADIPEKAQIERLRRAYSAGGPLPPSVSERFSRRYSMRVSQLYGATELASVTYSDPQDPGFDPACVGGSMNGVHIRIVDPAQPMRLLPLGEEGHVAIRADSMFEGYVDPGPPAPLIDGYFATGDLGKLDAHGRLTITGRLKLLIEVSGMKVNPLEVEAVLREHPLVGACVVVPVRQSQTVNRVKAVVTPRDPSRPPVVEELRALAREHLATYKVPRVFELRDSLPTTATGKVLRHLVETT